MLVDLPCQHSLLEDCLSYSSTLTEPVETYKIHGAHYMCAHLSAGPPTPRAGHYWLRCSHQRRRRCWHCGVHHHTVPSPAVHQYRLRAHILLTSTALYLNIGCWSSPSYSIVLVCAQGEITQSTSYRRMHTHTALQHIMDAHTHAWAHVYDTHTHTHTQQTIFVSLSNPLKIGTAEKKLLVIVIYLVILAVVALVTGNIHHIFKDYTALHQATV